MDSSNNANHDNENITLKLNLGFLGFLCSNLGSVVYSNRQGPKFLGILYVHILWVICNFESRF